MTNVKCGGGHEIDLLAIEPFYGDCYHVESSIHTKHKLRLRAKSPNDKDCMEYFVKQKFYDHNVKQCVDGLFYDNEKRQTRKYQRILVIWETKEPLREFSKKCENGMGIKIMSLQGIIYALSNDKYTSGSRDDILRTMELVRLEKKWEKEPDKQMEKLKQ
jgi:hypothetical protein